MAEKVGFRIEFEVPEEGTGSFIRKVLRDYGSYIEFYDTHTNLYAGLADNNVNRDMDVDRGRIGMWGTYVEGEEVSDGG